MYTLLLIVVTLVISLIITPIIIKVSFKFNLVDRPNYRKVHTKPVSVMGGTVILLSFLIGLWLGSSHRESSQTFGNWFNYYVFCRHH